MCSQACLALFLRSSRLLEERCVQPSTMFQRAQSVSNLRCAAKLPLPLPEDALWDEESVRARRDTYQVNNGSA
jgi:hypothetical protein